MHTAHRATVALFIGVLTFFGADVAAVHAEPGWVPTYVPGRFVHTVPADLDPPGIGRAGVARLEAALAKLKFPFYVIIMADLPGGDGDPDARARAVTDTLAERWAVAGADPATTSYFALTFQPRKFSLLVGARWKTEVGLEGAGLDPYLSRFLARVRGTPADPAGGIVDMAEAIDAYVFDRVDPARVAARRIESRRQTATRLRDELTGLLAEQPAYLPWELGPYRAAQGELSQLVGASADVVDRVDLESLDSRVAQLRQHVLKARAVEQERVARHTAARDGLAKGIRATVEALDDPNRPSDVAPYEAALRRAEAALRTDDVDLMTAARTQLETATAPLHATLAELRLAAEARARLMMWLLIGFVIALLIVGPIVVVRRVRRTRAFRNLIADADSWDEKLKNAAGRYVEFYGKRDAVLGLVEMTGRTAELLNAVTTEVDAIYTTVRAMEQHVATCRERAAATGFMAAGDMAEVYASLSAPFSFDTGVLNEADLFGPETRRVTIDPEAIEAELDQRFRASLDGWRRLDEAAERRFESPDTLLPHTTLDALLARMDEAGLPHRWLADHPLFGDDASDAAIYAEAEALRWQDALGYLEHIEGLRAVETRVAARVEELVSARGRALAARESHGVLAPDAVPEGRVVLDRRDDPRVALGTAETSWSALAAVLASPPADASAIDITACLAAADEVVARYTAVHDRVAAIADAIQRAPAIVRDELPQRHATLAATLDALVQRTEIAKGVHADVGVDELLETTREALVALASSNNGVAKLFEKKRLVEVIAGAERVRAAAADVEAGLTLARERLDALDATRARYLAELARADSLRESRTARIRSYGGTGELSHAPRPVINGPVDYTALVTVLNQTFDGWEAEERSARLVYEAEQRRRQEAAEAARRAAESARAAERARMRSVSAFSSSSRSSFSSSSRSSFSSSSRSSSSSSSRSSSSSSSRSGSYGGGGSSSRSGSW